MTEFRIGKAGRKYQAHNIKHYDFSLDVKQVGSTQAFTAPMGGGEVLFSYHTPVAAFIDNQWVRTSDRSWIINDKERKVTTNRHINKFMDGCTPKEVAQSVIDAHVLSKGVKA